MTLRITMGAWYWCWLMQDGKQVEENESSKAYHVKVRKGILKIGPKQK